MDDLISRQAAIDAVYERMRQIGHENDPSILSIIQAIRDLSSAQPDIKPTSYQDCANAMMMMWMDNVLTDGEYRRIMDKLNDH